MEGRSLFFSGDYRENDTFYRCDSVRGIHADMAVIDAAYSRRDRGDDLRKQVVEKAAALMKDDAPLLMPVPHYGRGLSMGILFHETFGRDHGIYMSPKLYDEWLHLGHRKYFVHDEITELPFSIFQRWDNETIEKGNIYFLTDAQLSRASSRELIMAHPDMGVLLTGSIHGYGKARSFFENGRAKFALWPNHLTWQEMEDLKAENDMGLVVPFHNKKVKPENDTFIF